MQERAIGVETEYIVVYVPVPSDPDVPSKRAIYDHFEAALRERVPALRNQPSPFNHKETWFLASGASFGQERRLGFEGEGPIEMASPECRDPVSLLAAEAAKDAWMEELAGIVSGRLRKLGYGGRAIVGKGSVDGEGNGCASHESYSVNDPLPPRRRRLVASFGERLLGIPGDLVMLASSEVVWIATGLLAVLGCAWQSTGLLTAAFFAPFLSWGAMAIATRPWGPERLHRFSRARRTVLRRIFLRPQQRGLPSHLATRIVFTGAGRVAFEGGALFRISARPESIREVLTEWGEDRGFFDLRDVILNRERASQPARRLHLLLGDANLCEWAMLLRVGTTALVLEAIEAAPEARWPELADPAEALAQVSADETLQVPLRLRDGGHASALEIQRVYLAQVRRTLGGAPLAEGKERVLEMWAETLELLERDRSALFGRVDWITKRALLDEVARRPDDWARLAADGARVMNAPEPSLNAEEHRLRELAFRLRAADLRYHELSPSGGLRLQEQRGRIWRATTPDAVARARKTPPSDTRAHARGELIQRLHRLHPPPTPESVGVRWDGVRLGREEWHLSPDPLDARAAERGDAAPGGSTDVFAVLAQGLHSSGWRPWLPWLALWVGVMSLPFLTPLLEAAPGGEELLRALFYARTCIGAVLVSAVVLDRFRRTAGFAVFCVLMLPTFAMAGTRDREAFAVAMSAQTIATLLYTLLFIDPRIPTVPRRLWLASVVAGVGCALPPLALIQDPSTAPWALAGLASALGLALAYRAYGRRRGAERVFDPGTCGLAALAVVLFAWPGSLGGPLVAGILGLLTLVAMRWLEPILSDAAEPRSGA